jgi:subtilase family serine protease
MLNPEQVISAQVLLVSATGSVVDGNTIITSENINTYRPSESTVQLVSQYFRASGFEVSPLVGISFTIAASARHFSDFFGVSLVEDSRGGIQASLGGATTQSELPLERLEKTITDSISSVTFVPPPDFGPTSF